MYHCHLHIYLTGRPCRAFEIMRQMPPMEHFTHTFSEGGAPGAGSFADADVIFMNLQNTEGVLDTKGVLDAEGVLDSEGVLNTFVPGKMEGAQLILLADAQQAASLADTLLSSEISDIWTLPMSDAEIRFRFLRWQQSCKREKDFWQTSQYLESTINSIPNLIWYKNKDGIHEKVNDSFCRTVKKTKQQVEGRDHAYIWDVDLSDPANDGYDCSASDLEVMRKKKTCVSEENVKTGDGMKLLTTYKSPLYDIDGSVMGTVGVGIDITQERAYEQEIIAKNHTLETIFTMLECGILCHSIDGTRILNVNDAALKILGYDSKEELMASGFHMMVPTVMEEDKPKFWERLQTLKKEGDSTNVEYRIQHKDGKIVYVLGNIKLVKENGELFYQRFLLDCTDQKLQEAENEKRHAALVQALSIDYNLVLFFDLDTGVGFPLRVSNDSDHLFDSVFSGDILLGESMERYMRAFVYEDDREMFLQAVSQEGLKEKLKKKKLDYVNYRMCIDGDVEYYELKIVRSGTWDESHGIILGFRSVDEETRNEMEKKRLLEDALAQANRANDAKSIFLSNMSHDIRTPMNAIIGFTTLAINNIDHRDQVKEYLDKIRVSGNHMLSLINDVLDMSQIESGKMQLEEASCSLPDILQGLNNIVQADILAKQLRLEIEITNVTHEEICCDKLRLNQVLLNVLSNSIKYTNPGGAIRLSLTEKATAPAGCASYEFRIGDTGIGMSEEFISHIFEPFERERDSTNSGIQGTGLGMAITKNIVDMMNGSIEVNSKPDVGTETLISITFRLSQENTEPEKPADFPGGAPAADSAPGTSDGASALDIARQKPAGNAAAACCGGRILLAEDNELNQEIATALLTDAGFDTDIAGNGKIAVDMVARSAPGYYRLVLMDIQMPVMNGYEAAKAIRNLEDPDLASIPILAMTANAFESDRQKALKCGMNGHIAKPIDVQKLTETLRQILA